MDIETDLICPNCGEYLVSPPNERHFNCPVCGRALELISRKKVVIAEPLPDFKDLDQVGAGDVWPSLEPSIPNWESGLSIQRRQRNTELTQARITQERVSNLQASRLGIWSMVLGIVSLGMGWLRQLYIPTDWVVIAMVLFGMVSLGGGSFITIRFYYVSRSLTKIENQHEKK